MISENHAYLTSAAAAEEIGLDLLTVHAKDFDVTITNQTEAFAAIGVMGPRSRDLLSSVSDPGENFPWMSTRNVAIAGHSVRALRVSSLGELG